MVVMSGERSHSFALAFQFSSLSHSEHAGGSSAQSITAVVAYLSAFRRRPPLRMAPKFMFLRK